jgi:hypothetical protein
MQRARRHEQQRAHPDDPDQVLQQEFCDHGDFPRFAVGMIARFSANLRRWVLPSRGGCRERLQTIWSIRVPWPGGSGGSGVGAAAPASLALLSLATSGALGALVSGVLTGAGAAILEILIGKILKITAADSDRAKDNAS